MFQTRRPAGRIVYLVLAVMIGATGIRLHAAPQSGPALTSVIDTVYRADGSEAQGTLVITWPAFVGASGAAVAAGSLNVTLGSNGALNVALATNAGATPAGRLLHRRLSVAAQRSANGILGGADEFSGNPGAGADDAGIGNGGATGLDAVRKFGTGGEGE